MSRTAIPDPLTAKLARFAAGLTPASLPSSVAEVAAVCLLDTLGCAVGGVETETTKIARAVTSPDPGPTAGGAVRGGRGRVIGAHNRFSTGADAAFLNGVMIRDLDFNDWYPGGHPSDCSGALVAIAEDCGADGARLIAACTVAYEIFARLCAAAPLKERGWDQGFGVAVATAAAAGNLLGLDAEWIAHAISLAAVAHLPMRATKSGNLSLWKGAAGSHAARCGLECARLAAAGMTGPEAVFSGRDGLFELVSGPFEVTEFGGGETDFFTPRVSFKYWPVCYGLQGPSTAALRLRERVPLDRIESLVVETYAAAYRLNGGDEAKWDPRNRATADHSIPYAIVRVMEHGTIDEAAFASDAFLEERIRPLMRRITVRIGEDAEKLYPDDVLVRFLVTDVDGGHSAVEVLNPPGHEKNPMTPAQVTEKFERLVAPHVGGERARAAAGFWTQVNSAADLRHGFELLALAAIKESPDV
jgi:2-methylcitrate dehydratase